MGQFDWVLQESERQMPVSYDLLIGRIDSKMVCKCMDFLLSARIPDCLNVEKVTKSLEMHTGTSLAQKGVLPLKAVGNMLRQHHSGADLARNLIMPYKYVCNFPIVLTRF